MKKTSQFHLKTHLLSLVRASLVVFLLFMTHCSEAPQVSGIVAVSKLETIACVPREKTFKIRNSESEAQRVTGVYFEFGTNEDKYYKILNVHANGRDYPPNGNRVTDIILPPGGTMKVTIEVNTRETTKTAENPGAEHTTLNGYLSVMLGGPQVGVMQIEIQTTTPRTIEGCSKENEAEGRAFEVVEVLTILSHEANGVVETPLDVSTAVEGDLILGGEESAVKIVDSGWPTIIFPLPETAPIPELQILLEGETPEADFSTGALTFEGVTLTSPGVGTFSGLSLTTGSITIDSSQAPQVAGGSLSLQGEDYDSATGEMTLVVAAPLNDEIPPTEGVTGGVFGLKIKLMER